MPLTLGNERLRQSEPEPTLAVSLVPVPKTVWQEFHGLQGSGRFITAFASD